MTTPCAINHLWYQLITEVLPAKQRLVLTLTEAQDTRIWSTVTTTFRSGSTRQLEIALAPQTAKISPPSDSQEDQIWASLVKHRIQSCLKVWIPWLIKLHRRVRCDYSLTLSVCDLGAWDPGILSMDSANADALIPDLYAMLAAGYPADVGIEPWGRPMPFSKFFLRWSKRSPRLFWRGVTSGLMPGGLIANVDQLAANPRVKLCLQQRHHAGSDIKISRVEWIDSSFKTQAEAWLKREGIIAPPVPESFFGNYRYYPDLPGCALAWGTIFKHLCGCLVFRTPQDRSLYYYKLMKPGQHYIEVPAGFSGLESAVQWADCHTEEAAWIAWCGYRVAHHYLRYIGDYFCDAAMPHIKPLLATS